MFSLDNIVLPTALKNKLSFLGSSSVEFGGFVDHIGANKFIILWFIFAFVLVLFLKNSVQLLNNMKNNNRYVIFIAFLLYYSLISMISIKSEFLYFNF